MSTNHNTLQQQLEKAAHTVGYARCMLDTRTGDGGQARQQPAHTRQTSVRHNNSDLSSWEDDPSDDIPF